MGRRKGFDFFLHFQNSIFKKSALRGQGVGGIRPGSYKGGGDGTS